MADKNQGVSLALLLSPTLIFIVLDQFGPPAIELLLNEKFWVPYVYYGSSILFGYILYRRSRIVKDMEWHRSKSIQRLEKVYRAEDKGVWLRAEAADNRLSVAAIKRPITSQKKAVQRLSGSISELNREGGPIEIASDESDVENVELFLEQEHVARNTERVAGKTGPIESVQGVTLEDTPDQSTGLLSGAMRRLSEARESAAQNQVKSKTSSGKIRDSVPISEGSSVDRIYVRAGEDYDPSPSSISNILSSTSESVESVQQDIRRCIECRSPLNSTESYCPKCGSFTS
jgi:hypothetical protein